MLADIVFAGLRVNRPLELTDTLTDGSLTETTGIT